MTYFAGQSFGFVVLCYISLFLVILIGTEQAVVVVREACVTAILVWWDVYMAVRAVCVLAVMMYGNPKYCKDISQKNPDFCFTGSIPV